MKRLFFLVFLFFITLLFSQNKNIQKFKTTYKDTQVDYIVITKMGDEKIKKPIFFFCQGSLTRPLKILSDDASFPILPFNEELLLDKYHLVMISKPGIPIEVHEKELKRDYTYPKEGLPDKEYIYNNNLDYYYKRNNFILKKLFKENWVEVKNTVVAGHSEGSYIALEMAVNNKKISRLIYSGGNPLGRMMSIISQTRQNPKEKENWNNKNLNFWAETIRNKDKKELDRENTSYYNYSLSKNFVYDLLSLKIPILVTYGTKDQNGLFNDYLNVLTIREGKTNFTFKPYFNCDHNFFPIDENMKINYEVDNWSKVGKLWSEWSK